MIAKEVFKKVWIKYFGEDKELYQNYTINNEGTKIRTIKQR